LLLIYKSQTTFRKQLSVEYVISKNRFCWVAV